MNPERGVKQEGVFQICFAGIRGKPFCEQGLFPFYSSEDDVRISDIDCKKPGGLLYRLINVRISRTGAPHQHACFSRAEMPLLNIAQPDMHIKENLFCACCHDKIGMLPRGLF